MVAQGDTIFHNQGLCFTCHNADSKGTANAPDLTDDVWINITGRNYDEIVGLVTTGVAQPKQFPTPMPPKGGSTITDDQVRAVAAYVFSLGQH
jgi:mono/diheme cytochrome c family protein